MDFPCCRSYYTKYGNVIWERRASSESAFSTRCRNPERGSTFSARSKFSPFLFMNQSQGVDNVRIRHDGRDRILFLDFVSCGCHLHNHCATHYLAQHQQNQPAAGVASVAPGCACGQGRGSVPFRRNKDFIVSAAGKCGVSVWKSKKGRTPQWRPALGVQSFGGAGRYFISYDTGPSA